MIFLTQLVLAGLLDFLAWFTLSGIFATKDFRLTFNPLTPFHVHRHLSTRTSQLPEGSQGGNAWCGGHYFPIPALRGHQGMPYSGLVELANLMVSSARRRPYL